MMSRKLLVTLLLVVLCTCAAYMFLLGNIRDSEITDRVAINSIVKLTEQNWGAVRGDMYPESPYDFAVVDSSDILLYQSAAGIAGSVNEAINHRDTLIDVTVQDLVVGKVIIHNDYSAVFSRLKLNFTLVSAAALLLLILLCLAYILQLNRMIFRPFRQMQRFAKHIAKGELDIPLEMDQDNMFGAFTESFDLMREELAAARHNEYLANKSKQELVASLSHDIKTPVSSIKAITELMLLSADNDKVSRQLNTLYAKADQIDHLVTDMFHATMEELNELQVNTTEEPSTLLAVLIENANYYEQITAAPIPECLLSTDPLRLQQVIDNVVNNSYKYAGTAIDVACETVEGFLVMQFTDYGPGVPGDELPLLFNKFYRGSRAVHQSGSGLGLYISRYLMRKMHGDIVCYSSGNGFIVKLLIPLAGKN
ncbi:HAMP domain-containing protein [Paenibacillus sp. LMG 31459]|uniref:histidine kinase n=1 Tax=Paenibacillus phytohabitans TaxID=2654978 RepID=A0ABX1YQF7_9BACL|nr:HAMP domain-containing sensor histidine kinase [Paenibacillus phytohabitans]NOU81859.1 HAMP domain-containing protein [Paenibacillus phytohabitans]